jgi:CRP-like cAMP-binding protein
MGSEAPPSSWVVSESRHTLRRLLLRLEYAGLPPDNGTVDVEALAAVPFFAPLSPAGLEAVAPYAERIEVPAGTPLTGQERWGFLFFVIESGEAAVWQDDRQLGTLRDGDFFGELAILRTGERTASVSAKTQMRLVTVTEAGFRRLVETDPAAAQACEAAIAERWAART